MWRNHGSPKPTMLPGGKRPKRVLRPEDRGLKLADQPAAIATVLHDLKVGNLEHARKIASTFLESGPEDIKVADMSPGLLRACVLKIKGALEEAGIR